MKKFYIYIYINNRKILLEGILSILEGNVLLSGVGGHAFSYEGCFNHSAGGNTPVNFPGWAEYGVDSVEECLEHCLNQSKSYFGITDSDCPSAGKQADCHCGERLPTEQYQDDACRDCIDNDGKEYHCGKCGWNLDVYRIHQSKMFMLLILCRW